MGSDKNISQRSLFDQEPVVLNIQNGRQNRDKGIKRAVDHADKEHNNWREAAYQILVEFVNKSTDGFLCEDIRKYAVDKGFPEPPHNRAWGAIIAKASKENIIKQVGFAKVKNAKANCANVALWKKK